MTTLRHLLAFLPFPLIFLVISPIFGGPAFAAPTTMNGYWVTEGYASVVEVGPCETAEASLCGEIVWLWAAVDGNGQPVLDAENPDRELRRQPLLGRHILIHMVRGSSEPLSASGDIYNPGDGRTYRATMTLVDDDTLYVEGCVLFLCKTQVWRRPSALPRFDDPQA